MEGIAVLVVLTIIVMGLFSYSTLLGTIALVVVLSPIWFPIGLVGTFIIGGLITGEHP
jgi:hypothetical protein